MAQRFESRATLTAPPEEVFAYLDDPSHLAAHMAKPSWAMAGGRMELRLDETGGRQVDSRMHLATSPRGAAAPCFASSLTTRCPRRFPGAGSAGFSAVVTPGGAHSAWWAMRCGISLEV